MLFIFVRAFSEFEFEDVRKLSAELCGRIHPQVISFFFFFLVIFREDATSTPLVLFAFQFERFFDIVFVCNITS